MKNRHLCLFLLAICLALRSGPARANITVDAARVLRDKPPGLGGVSLNPHSGAFAANADGIDYQGDLKAAGVKLARTLAYPDSRAPGHDLAWFDRNVTAIQAAGAAPLFVAYIRPGLPYVRADGGSGGTVETNLVFLVRRYQAAPFNLQNQTWEIGQQPNLAVDYKVKNPDEYCAIFNRCHEALLAAGLRDNVTLCGPALSVPYRATPGAGAFMDTFLAQCAGSVDVVTYHHYAAAQNGSAILSLPQKLDDIEDPARSLWTGDFGMAALLAKMTVARLSRPNAGIGLTEHNTATGVHRIASGLWNLAVLRYHLLNPRGRLTAMAVFDDYGRRNGTGLYDEGKRRDYAYWALWIHHNLRGQKVLEQKTTGHMMVDGRPWLLVTGTRDDGFLYVEVINRDTTARRDHIEVQNATVGSPTLFTMADGITPNQGQEQTLGTAFDYEFPPLSATIFKFPLLAPPPEQPAKPPDATPANPTPNPTPNPVPDVQAANLVVTDLMVKDLRPGSGLAAKNGDAVTVHYRLTLSDGKLIYSSFVYGRPYTFRLGAGQVIKGLEQGVRGLKVGGKRRLIVPPELAYGTRGVGAGIPPNATLVFEVELLRIN